MRVLCVFALTVSILAPFPFAETVASAFTSVWLNVRSVVVAQTGPQEALPPRPPSNYAQRIKLITRTTREVTFGEPIVSLLIIDPNIASAAIKGDRGALVTGLMRGQTVLIISGRSSRAIYAIEVERPPVVPRSGNNQNQVAEQLESVSGFYSLFVTPGSDGRQSLLRHNFESRQSLANGRTLRASGELFNFFGRGERGLTLPLGSSFGANRLTLGLDSSTSKLDLLDSELNVSRLSFNGYSLRGLHFVSTAKSRWHGLQLFAGNARPQLSLFNKGEGRLAGAFVPVAEGTSWRIRTGVFSIVPRRKVASQQGGVAWQTDASYTPDERTAVEGELIYANSGFSWRTKVDLQRNAFNFHGEFSRVDRRSPLIPIGAQSAGRFTSEFSLQWRPTERFNASVGYNRTSTVPVVGFKRIELNNRTFLARANFYPTRGAHWGFSFNQQVIDAPGSTLVPFLLNLQTRSLIFRYGQRISRHWTNDFGTRFIFSREANADAKMSQGLTLHEQLRYSIRGGSVTGFVNYRSNTPSLESLIVRNPALLPAEFRTAFGADPVRFLRTNRDALPQLLNGIQLPLARDTEAGLRLQVAFARVNLIGEAVFSTGKLLAREQHTLLASFSANIKLDAANSVQVSTARGFAFSGTGSQASLTVGYIHRFGGGSDGGGFRFAKLLGLDRGRIQGRVFLDLNGNGHDDTEEPGVAGMKVQIDGNRSVVTDPRGNFNFGSLTQGDYDVALISDELGVMLRASNTTLQHVSLSARQTINLSFGLTNFGFAAGCVFNDLSGTGKQSAGDAPGINGVRIILRATKAIADTEPLVQIVNGSGQYEFRNLSPGRYTLEIDPESLPADFQLPANTSWPLTIAPLLGTYLDIPLVAHRAVSGVVFIDKDDDGKFDPQKDEVVQAARVTAGASVVLSDGSGRYLLRNLPAGKIAIWASNSRGDKSNPITIRLEANPIMVLKVNLAIPRIR